MLWLLEQVNHVVSVHRLSVLKLFGLKIYKKFTTNLTKKKLKKSRNRLVILVDTIGINSKAVNVGVENLC